MDPIAQAEVARITAILLAVCAGIASAYFIGATAIAFTEAQAAASLGRPAALAEAARTLTPALLCLVISFNARSVAEAINSLVGNGLSDGNSLIQVWRGVAASIANTVIVCSAAWLAIGVATGLLDGQIALITGRRHGLAPAYERLIAVIATAILAVLSLRLADALIRMLL
jgi:hypothetical protein